MNVTNLDSVTFGITDFAACRRFWTDFGLTESAADDGATVFSCKNGSSVVLRDANDPKLPAPVEPGATQREAVFGGEQAVELGTVDGEIRAQIEDRRERALYAADAFADGERGIGETRFQPMRRGEVIGVRMRFQ